MNGRNFIYITSGLFRDFVEVQVLLGRTDIKKSLWKGKETNSPSLLDKFDRYISNLFLGLSVTRSINNYEGPQ